ncbi:hypothetical protein Tco_0901855 [Tanacetum coccineum]
MIVKKNEKPSLKEEAHMGSLQLLDTIDPKKEPLKVHAKSKTRKELPKVENKGEAGVELPKTKVKGITSKRAHKAEAKSKAEMQSNEEAKIFHIGSHFNEMNSIMCM